MNQSMIVAPYLAKARADLDDAMQQIGHLSASDDRDAINYLGYTSEALMRAIASVSLAVERLAELVVDD